jgi:hypothetical protein
VAKGGGGEEDEGRKTRKEGEEGKRRKGMERKAMERKGRERQGKEKGKEREWKGRTKGNPTANFVLYNCSSV